MSEERAIARSLLSVIAALLRPFQRTAPKPVILISGMPRVGKTRLARKIAKHTGFGVIHSDELRRGFWQMPEMDARAAERRRAYVEALAARRYGIVLEGVDLVVRNAGNPALVKRGEIKRDLTPSLELVSMLSQQFQAKAFIVGCADADPRAKRAAIRRYETAEDWTARISDGELEELAERIVRDSGELRKEVQQRGFDYIEVPVDALDEHLDRAAQRILAAIRSE